MSLLFVYLSGPRCCFVILMTVYDVGVVLVCESFSTRNNLCLYVVLSSPGTVAYQCFCGYGGDV